MINIHKAGLVLAGGGAKGAYQVGAIKYLAEIGFSPEIIAGTSIGALNGSVLASYPSFSFASKYLDQMWNKLGQLQILHFNSKSAFLKTTKVASQAFLSPFAGWLHEFLIEHKILDERDSFFDPEPIENLLRETINPVDLYEGTELWVTAILVPNN